MLGLTFPSSEAYFTDNNGLILCVWNTRATSIIYRGHEPAASASAVPYRVPAVSCLSFPDVRLLAVNRSVAACVVPYPFASVRHMLRCF